MIFEHVKKKKIKIWQRQKLSPNEKKRSLGWPIDENLLTSSVNRTWNESQVRNGIANEIHLQNETAIRTPIWISIQNETGFLIRKPNVSGFWSLSRIESQTSIEIPIRSGSPTLSGTLNANGILRESGIWPAISRLDWRNSKFRRELRNVKK